eukprot:1187465-Prorocentrum_minimum.AAC.1
MYTVLYNLLYTVLYNLLYTVLYTALYAVLRLLRGCRWTRSVKKNTPGNSSWRKTKAGDCLCLTIASCVRKPIFYPHLVYWVRAAIDGRPLFRRRVAGELRKKAERREMYKHKKVALNIVEYRPGADGEPEMAIDEPVSPPEQTKQAFPATAATVPALVLVRQAASRVCRGGVYAAEVRCARARACVIVSGEWRVHRCGCGLEGGGFIAGGHDCAGEGGGAGGAGGGGAETGGAADGPRGGAAGHKGGGMGLHLSLFSGDLVRIVSHKGGGMGLHLSLFSGDLVRIVSHKGGGMGLHLSLFS